jgi:hypothetical protein
VQSGEVIDGYQPVCQKAFYLSGNLNNCSYMKVRKKGDESI